MGNIHLLPEKESCYSRPSNHIVIDHRLTGTARSVAHFFISCPKDWIISVKGTVKCTGFTEYQVRAAFALLVQVGYMTCEPIKRKNGRFERSIWSFYEWPVKFDSGLQNLIYRSSLLTAGNIDMLMSSLQYGEWHDFLRDLPLRCQNSTTVDASENAGSSPDAPIHRFEIPHAENHTLQRKYIYKESSSHKVSTTEEPLQEKIETVVKSVMEPYKAEILETLTTTFSELLTHLKPEATETFQESTIEHDAVQEDAVTTEVVNQEPEIQTTPVTESVEEPRPVESPTIVDLPVTTTTFSDENFSQEDDRDTVVEEPSFEVDPVSQAEEITAPPAPEVSRPTAPASVFESMRQQLKSSTIQIGLQEEQHVSGTGTVPSPTPRKLRMAITSSNTPADDATSSLDLDASLLEAIQCSQNAAERYRNQWQSVGTIAGDLGSHAGQSAGTFTDDRPASVSGGTEDRSVAESEAPSLEREAPLDKDCDKGAVTVKEAVKQAVNTPVAKPQNSIQAKDATLQHGRECGEIEGSEPSLDDTLTREESPIPEGQEDAAIPAVQPESSASKATDSGEKQPVTNTSNTPSLPAFSLEFNRDNGYLGMHGTRTLGMSPLPSIVPLASKMMLDTTAFSEQSPAVSAGSTDTGHSIPDGSPRFSDTTGNPPTSRESTESSGHSPDDRIGMTAQEVFDLYKSKGLGGRWVSISKFLTPEWKALLPVMKPRYLQKSMAICLVDRNMNPKIINPEYLVRLVADRVKEDTQPKTNHSFQREQKDPTPSVRQRLGREGGLKRPSVEMIMGYRIETLNKYFTVGESMAEAALRLAKSGVPKDG